MMQQTLPSSAAGANSLRYANVSELTTVPVLLTTSNCFCMHLCDHT